MGYTKFEIELALFEIFRDFTWREVDVIEKYDLNDDHLETSVEPEDDFVIDFGANISYTTDPQSESNKELIHELTDIASEHGLKISLELPNNDLLCDISADIVDIQVSKDWNGKWRIQPNFTIRIPSD